MGSSKDAIIMLTVQTRVLDLHVLVLGEACLSCFPIADSNAPLQYDRTVSSVSFFPSATSTSQLYLLLRL